LFCIHTRHRECSVTSQSYTDSLTLFLRHLLFHFAENFTTTLLTVTVNFHGCLAFYIMWLSLVQLHVLLQQT